ncbi:hypothetical protein NDU88_001156 [Pleurodeles waltl]|uniref:Uncharacterized protein n=1 Tax=Pleurodeles waltl TaxID=8319 RepID=A0AAV7R691_PLEWA|nr:hypothetical protein NDU88_001156 [Pleurodeles waltl]
MQASGELIRDKRTITDGHHTDRDASHGEKVTSRAVLRFPALGRDKDNSKRSNPRRLTGAWATSQRTAISNLRLVAVGAQHQHVELAVGE